MPRHKITVECRTPKSFRVAQIAGMFDVPIEAKQRATFEVELPALEEDWKIGVIVGPSGSGKSTVATHVYGAELYASGDWPDNRAVIDCFGEHDAKTITSTLTAVGFSSPPSWIKPYRVLSNGEKFRCDLARALLSDRSLIVFDEFTSVVDRTVAKIGSAAVSKAIRQWLDRRFIAVTCHYDVVEWLEPDWVLDMRAGKLARGRLRRPPLRVRIFEGKRDLWPLFARHHYMSPTVPRACKFWCAEVEGQLAACCVTGAQIGNALARRVSRIVTLPDFQGVGVGGKLLDTVADHLHAQGLKVTIATRHPGMVQRLQRSPLWTITAAQKCSSNNFRHIQERQRMERTCSRGKALVSAKYTPPRVAE